MHSTADHAFNASRFGENRRVIYAYGQSALGDFIATVDENRISSILFGDSKADLLDDLRETYPEQRLIQACPTYGAFLLSAVTRPVERISTTPVFRASINDGDF